MKFQINKIKLLNLLLILASLFGYLEWSKGSHTFLFQAEAEIIGKLFTEPGSVLHPFILLPLTGQILLLISILRNRPGKFLTFTGMAMLALLLLFMLFIGIISLNWKIILSTLPFIIVSVLIIKGRRVL